MPRRPLPVPRPRSHVATLARVLGDSSRVAMLETLLDGEAHAIGRLAKIARVSAATASSHLRKLVDAQLVVIETVGRERHVRLASSEVAELLERLAVLGTTGAPVPRDELRFARTCYDHLAGVLGVLVVEALVARGWLHRTSDNLEPAPDLFRWLADHGHPVEIAGRRPLSRACVDWTERVPHVAGRIGAALCAVARDERWVVRVRDSRALRLTDRGRSALARELGVALPQARRG